MDEARGQTGFTLIELAIVLLIIGVLAAIAAPRFADLRPRAGDAAIDATAAAVQSAHAIAVVEHLRPPNCAELFAQMRGLAAGDGPTRTIPGRGATTTIECEPAAPAAATTVRVWNDQATTQRTRETALRVTF